MSNVYAPVIAKQRWIKPYYWTIAGATSRVVTAGRVYLIEFEVLTQAMVDAVAFVNAATVAGNITVGIYGPIATEETCDAAPLLVQSASTALTGVNTPQVVTFTPTLLSQGRYYAAVECSDGTHTLYGSTNQNQIVGQTQRYDRGGGYGTLTNPCPTPTNENNSHPIIQIRCST